MKFSEEIGFIRKQFKTDAFIPIHEPRFIGNEKKYLNEVIDSTFVSSNGPFIDLFERRLAEYTGAGYAVAAVNGTNALQVALRLAGVEQGDEVLTQALSFIATANAITYLGAEPVFLDIDESTLGLSPDAVKRFLTENAEIRDSGIYNKTTGRRISACVPMHTFGFPGKLDQLLEVCEKYRIPLVEDAAESIGSLYKGKHTGTLGLAGIFSFNGNKIITAGGGGAIITDDEHLAKMAKHLTTQAKVPHRWEYVHDHIGYNFRMPNLNAALLCAQMEQLDNYLENKRELAHIYSRYFSERGIRFLTEPPDTRSNYWLMGIVLENRAAREQFLTESNDAGVMTRPVWKLLNELTMFKHCQTDDLHVSRWYADRVVNIPSSVRV